MIIITRAQSAERDVIRGVVDLGRGCGYCSSGVEVRGGVFVGAGGGVSGAGGDGCSGGGLTWGCRGLSSNGGCPCGGHCSDVGCSCVVRCTGSSTK